MTTDLDSILNPIPEAFRRPLIDDFLEMEKSYRLSDWEKVGLKLGKICETSFGIAEGLLSGTFASTPAKPNNMIAACTRLEQIQPQASRSLRIQIPRLIIAAYELRNNRSIGHVGGDVNPNHMDAELFLRIGKWILSEFIRNVGSLSLDNAAKIVETLTKRDHATIWQDGKIKRVLADGLKFNQQVMALLYTESNSIKVSDMLDWTEYSNPSLFRSRLLLPLHKSRLIEFDRKQDTIKITDKGIQFVEETHLLDGSVKTAAVSSTRLGKKPRRPSAKSSTAKKKTNGQSVRKRR